MQNFGEHLKFWRNERRMSQLQLAVEADVSSRHISFLESGRAGPSRSMILHLADVLDVPRQQRNGWLGSAGFAALYSESNLNDEHMGSVKSAMDLLIEQHNPYPAIIMDRVWSLVSLNPVATMLFGLAGLKTGDSLLDYIAQPGRAASMIENWGEVGHHALTRMRSESRAAGGIPELYEAAATLAQDPDVAAFDPKPPLNPVVQTIYRAGDLRLPLFSTFAQFGGAEDITLTELKIELMFPADDMTGEVLKSLAGQA